MPIYEYECDKCGVRFERIQRFSDDPLTDCPECEGHVHRVIQPVGVVFKGSGFYVTDNRQSSNGSSREQVSAPKKEEAKSTDTAGDD